MICSLAITPFVIAEADRHETIQQFHGYLSNFLSLSSYIYLPGKNAANRAHIIS